MILKKVKRKRTRKNGKEKYLASFRLDNKNFKQHSKPTEN